MGIIDTIRNKQDGKRKFYGAVLDDNIQDASYRKINLAKDKHYFRIKLCEMFLKNKTSYLENYIPMAVALNIFDYAAKKREIPVLLGNQLLQQVEKYVKDQSIEFRNLPIVGPVPYIGSDIGFFIGLYRVAVDNLAKSLFEFANTLIKAFGLSDFSNVLGLADQLGNSIAKLIGLSEVQMRFGAMDTFSSQETLRDRYLLFINGPDNEIDLGKLWVKEGRLFIGDAIDDNIAYTHHDYCLVRIEVLENRTDFNTLPFHAKFTACKARIWKGDLPEAKRLFLTLMRDLSCSPDLTIEDRGVLMKTYLANYQQECENHAMVTGRLETNRTGPHRGAIRSDAQPLTVIEALHTAGISSELKIKKSDLKKVRSNLHSLTDNWQNIPHLKSCKKPLRLTDDDIFDQFMVIKASGKGAAVPPEALADIICFAAVQGGLAAY